MSLLDDSRTPAPAITIDRVHRFESSDFYRLEATPSGFEVWQAYYRYPRGALSLAGPFEIVHVRRVTILPDQAIANQVMEILNSVKEDIWDGAYDAGENAEALRQYDLPRD